MNEYRLKFKWGELQVDGVVRVISDAAGETHELIVRKQPVATFRKRRAEPDEHGETRLIKDNKLVGEGNLLAGVLFSLGMAELDKPRAHKTAFRDFILDYFVTLS